MSRLRNYDLMSLTSLAASVGVAVASCMIAVFRPTAWQAWLMLAAASSAIAAGTVGLLYAQVHKNHLAARRHLRDLAQLNPRDVLADTTAGDVPPLPNDHPLASAVAEVRQALLAHCRQLQELEHNRTASEIRCRRAAAEANRIKTIFTELSQPILVVDGYDELVLLNRAAGDLLGIDPEQPESRLLAEVVQCRELLDLLTGTTHRKKTASRSGEIDLPDAAGHPRFFRVTASTLAEEESESAGRPTGGAVAVFQDIGDQKALRKRNAEFVSSVSHEMKTPLAGIKAYVELLIDGDAEDEETREEFLQVIDGQADRLQRLVENLLNLARIEAGVVKVSKRNQSLNEVLDEALQVVQPSAEAKSIQLTSDLSPMYLGVLADRDMLLQSAINLLSNAIKYTPEGGSVTLRSRMDDGHVRFEVEDTGVGLSEEDRDRVFEKFYRVKKDKNMAAGTGLGLPLAKHIVEDVHGGCLTVTSTLGQGSTFSISLPNAAKMG